jgi:hypothetical protein
MADIFCILTRLLSIIFHCLDDGCHGPMAIYGPFPSIALGGLSMAGVCWGTWPARWKQPVTCLCAEKCLKNIWPSATTDVLFGQTMVCPRMFP